MLGNSAVGKTSLAASYTQAIVSKEHVPTVGTGFYNADVTINDEIKHFDIWDTAGQELYRGLVPQYIRNSQGAIIVYDVTERTSFLALNSWFDMTTSQPQPYQILLFANKIDKEESRQISTEEGRRFAMKYNCQYAEGSALTNSGVIVSINDFFKTISENCVEQPFYQPILASSEKKPCSC